MKKCGEGVQAQPSPHMRDGIKFLSVSQSTVCDKIHIDFRWFHFKSGDEIAITRRDKIGR